MSEQVLTNRGVCGAITVHVKDGKVIRVRPLAVEENELKPWTITARGRKFSPPKKITVEPYTLIEKTRLYADERIKYPYKRVDFDPKGNRHPETRGKAGYERISWDEALDIVAGEIKRIQKTYGTEAVAAMTSSHHSAGIVGYKLGPFMRFFNLIGYTQVFDNPDSWEGFHWGAIHTWGFYWRLGCPEPYDLLEDALKNTELMVWWSNDPDTTRSDGQDAAIWRIWLKEAGIKHIFIDPFYNYTAALVGDKWIAPRPGTDTALAMAIAYIWIDEGTYDKDYVATHSVGFEEFQKYIMGKEDGVPKTPQWAAELSGVPARTISALAREWASKRTMLSCGMISGLGSAGRQAYGHEWGRMMVLLQAMQGLGKPGVNMWGTCTGGPYNFKPYFPGYADKEGIMSVSRVAKKHVFNPVKQRLYRLLLPDAILNPPISWIGEGFCGESIDQQFKPYTYPMPDHSEIKMFYRYGNSFIGTMTETNRWVQAYQSPKLEFVVNQDCWWGSESKFADIILPACTSLERNDISEPGRVGGYGEHCETGYNYRTIVLHKKCVEPLWESKSDYQIFSLIAERLGLKEDFTDGKTEEDWVRAMFDYSGLPELMSWEEFERKGYCVIPLQEDYKPTPALRWFYEGRECDTPDPFNPKRNTKKAKELGTYSGKIEFASQSLKANLPDDKERPPVPHYTPSWEGHTSELARKYPLQLIAPHARYSIHTNYDKGLSWMGEIPGHRTLKDGYYWRPVRIHPLDAEARGIKDGDIVKVHNDRGAVLCLAKITERVKPGVVHCYQASGVYDPLEPGKPYSVDRGGCINLLTSARMCSKNAPGMAPNSCLVEISKWEV